MERVLEHSLELEHGLGARPRERWALHTLQAGTTTPQRRPRCRGTLLYTAMQVVRLELIVLEGVVKVGEALVDDWQNSDAGEQKRPG